MKLLPKYIRFEIQKGAFPAFSKDTLVGVYVKPDGKEGRDPLTNFYSDVPFEVNNKLIQELCNLYNSKE